MGGIQGNVRNVGATSLPLHTLRMECSTAPKYRGGLKAGFLSWACFEFVIKAEKAIASTLVSPSI
jgi:hypothetical protein